MKTKKYPLFEPDQVLTSGHLNMLMSYLESEDRQSRNKLHGIGIVCGLEVNRNVRQSGATSTVEIGQGVGITSAGYLINIDKATCASYRIYSDPAKYDRWIEDEKQVELLELLTNEDVEDLAEDVEVHAVNEISGDAMHDYVVVLYLEKQDIDLKNCTPDDCNDKGIIREFKIRKLLVGKQHLQLLLSDEHGQDRGASESTLDRYINRRHYLRELKLQPFRPPQLDEVQVEHIVAQYNMRIRQAIPAISNAVNDVLNVHEQLIENQEIKTHPAKNLEQNLIDEQSQLTQTNAPAFNIYTTIFLISGMRTKNSGKKALSSTVHVARMKCCFHST